MNIPENSSDSTDPINKSDKELQTDKIDSNKKINNEKANMIIEKWLKLQKVIKEENSLKELSSKFRGDNQNAFHKLYVENFQNKIKEREIFENLFQQNDSSNTEKFIIMENPPKKIDDIFTPIQNLFFFLRDHLEYIILMVEIIEKEKLMSKKENFSFIYLLCHHFFDNIFIQKYENNEKLNFIFFLLKREILHLTTSSNYDFLSKDSFAGKFFDCLSLTNEFKNFMGNDIYLIIKQINDNTDKCVDINPFVIYNYIQKNNKNKGIKASPTTNEIKAAEAQELKRIESLNLSYTMMMDLYEKEKDESVKELIHKCIYKIRSTENNQLYSFQQLTATLDYLQNSGICVNIIYLFIENYMEIKIIVNKILSLLSEKINIFPYQIRCICKVIFILINKTFPKISLLEKYSFIGKYLFGTYIFPMILNENFHSVVIDTFLSKYTKICLNSLKRIIKNISEGVLFESTVDEYYTIFNSFIIEKIPKMIKFYEEVIDVDFPMSLVQLTENFEKEDIISTYKKNKADNIKEVIEDIKNNYSISIDYFKEHPNEIADLLAICFSMDELLYFEEILKSRVSWFENFPQYIMFKKTLHKIFQVEFKKKDNAPQPQLQPDEVLIKAKYFLVIFKLLQNPYLDEKKETIDESSDLEEQNQTYIVTKIKESLKEILNYLSYLNIDNYPHLMSATSSENFFKCLHKILNDLKEFRNYNANSIPVVWYSDFIIKNYNDLPEAYKENDFNKLYEELYEKEKKSFTNCQTLFEMNLSKNLFRLKFSEIFIINSNKHLLEITDMEKFLKAKRFIFQTRFEICIHYKDYPEIKANNEMDEAGCNDMVQVHLFKDCPFKKLKYLNKFTDGLTSFKKSEEKQLKKPSLHDFVRTIMKRKNLFETDVAVGNKNCSITNLIKNFLDIVMEYLDKDIYIRLENEATKNLIRGLIFDYILKKTYPYVFPKERLNQDLEFYNKACKISVRLSLNDFKIHNENTNLILKAIVNIKSFDYAQSLQEKMNYVQTAYSTLNNCIKFNSGKTEKAYGADDITPLFHYIVVKAQPERFYSNLNYIQIFIDLYNDGSKNFLFGQLKSTYMYVMNYVFDD
ncbi:MAG: hypothetical protein MJ252_04630 [archaeon]|nr:hypothetical protein [archaeon]